MRFIEIRVRLMVTLTFMAAPAIAAPKPLIGYFKPMPIVGKLSTTVWGAATVGARDPANGLEDNGASGGVGSQQQTNFYWDGKVIKGEDGKYHLYASRWPRSKGFGPPVGAGGTGWQQSIPMQAVSDNIMGPYVLQGDCYTKNQQGNNMGHNVTALVTPTGTSPYILSVGEIVPGQLFSSKSANGPWTILGPTQTSTNGHNGCGETASNFTFTVGGDNRFWATSRAGCVMDSDQVQGPYKIETDSVLPDLEHGDNRNAEDECIWYSGGYYHIVYNYWDFQRAYHIMSKDGIRNWTNTGAAYQGTQSPANSYSNWLRYTDGTVNTWHNLERVGVYQENGHVTHFTFAVTDVDKNTSAMNTGGSKILVVPFDGVQFDCDNGDQASCTELAAPDGGATGSTDGGAGRADGNSAASDGAGGSGGGSGSGGAMGAGGKTGGGGASGSSATTGSGGRPASGGTTGNGGATGSGGVAGTGGGGLGSGGTSRSGGVSGSGGTVRSDSAGAAGGAAASGSAGNGGSSGSRGLGGAGESGSGGATSGASASGGPSSGSGCGCVVGARPRALSYRDAGFLVGIAMVFFVRRRRR